jgi:hypothetical protein
MNKRISHIARCGILMLLAVSAIANAATLVPVSVGKQAPALKPALVPDFKPGRKSMGLTWSKATYAKMGKMYVALDADTPGATRPTCLKIVAGYIPAFSRGTKIPLTFAEKKVESRGKTYTLQAATIGPASIKARIKGKTVEQMIVGECLAAGGQMQLRLAVATRLAAKVTIAGKAYALVAYDTDGDLKISNGETAELIRGKVHIPVPVNMLTRVGETWCTLKYDAASNAVSASEFKGQTASIISTADIAQLALMNAETGRLAISGKAGTAIPVPVAAYKIGLFNLILNPKSGAGYQGALPSKLTVAVAKGKPTTLPLPKTLFAKFQIAQAGRKVRLSVALSDDAGSRSVTLTRHGKVVPPEFEVVDSSGKVVYSNRLEYG